jgi:hypothetical protein
MGLAIKKVKIGNWVTISQIFGQYHFSNNFINFEFVNNSFVMFIKLNLVYYPF